MSFKVSVRGGGFFSIWRDRLAAALGSAVAGVIVMTALVLAASPAGTATSPSTSDSVRVFKSGDEGYHTFRIPAIVRAANGDLLAFSEGRVNAASDSGNIDLVMRRSVDGGRSWGKLQVIADNGDGVFGNPAPVVERATGRVVLLLVEQDSGSHEGEIMRGERGRRTPHVMRSEDHGATWSAPESLEESCDRESWGWYATGPCHGIQLQNGKFPGRLVVPANHSSLRHGKSGSSAHAAHLLLSDDGGVTWRIGAVGDTHLGKGEVNPNESSVAELSNGELYVNARDQGGRSPAARAHAWSKDGGETLVEPFAPVDGLVTPVCQASLLPVGTELLLSAPSKANARERLAIRISDDRGVTWREALVVEQGAAAYSDLVLLGEERFGVLYEAESYAVIRFRAFERDDLLPEARRK